MKPNEFKSPGPRVRHPVRWLWNLLFVLCITLTASLLLPQAYVMATTVMAPIVPRSDGTATIQWDVTADMVGNASGVSRELFVGTLSAVSVEPDASATVTLITSTLTVFPLSILGYEKYGATKDLVISVPPTASLPFLAECTPPSTDPGYGGSTDVYDGITQTLLINGHIGFTLGNRVPGSKDRIMLFLKR